MKFVKPKQGTTMETIGSMASKPGQPTAPGNCPHSVFAAGLPPLTGAHRNNQGTKGETLKGTLGVT